jgi:sugar/nucleoside kinase (ribokinase family)
MHKENLYKSPNPQNTIDVSGAGDTFLAALAFKYMQKNDMSDAIDYANLLSSKVVSKKGISTI